MPSAVPATRVLRLAFRVWMAALVFLLPIKLGTVVVVGEIGMFPINGWDWLFGQWPPFLVPVFAGLSLLGAVLLYPVPPRSRGWLVPGAWGLLALSGLAGLVRTTEWDAAQLMLWHLLGTAALVLAAFWAGSAEARLPRWLLVAVCAGVVGNALYGWQQVKGGGFQQTRDFVEQQAQAAGREVSGNLAVRLGQDRAFGFLVYPNSYAAHLILAGPLAVFLLWRAGRRVQPEKVSRLLFVAFGLLAVAGALWFSASRAAMLALGGGLAAATLVQPALKRWRLPLVVLGAAAGVGLLLAVSQGRALESMGARFGYYRAAVQMLGSQPLTGVGLGEFFPHYMRLKPENAEETRLPHNMLLGLAAQCGLAGGVAAALCLALPLLLVWLCAGAAAGRISPGVPAAAPGSASPEVAGVDVPLVFAAQVGLAAWSLHSLADFNFEIACFPALVGVLTVVMVQLSGAPEPPAVPGQKGKRSRGGGPAAPVARDVAATPAGTAWSPSWRRVFVGTALVLALAAVAGIWRWPGEQAYQEAYNAIGVRDFDLDVLRAQALTAARLLPSSPQPWQLLGRAAEGCRAYPLAIEAYGEAVKRSPHRAAFFTHLARNHLSQGDRAAARQAMAQALAWYPLSRANRELAVEIEAADLAPNGAHLREGH